MWERHGKEGSSNGWNVWCVRPIRPGTGGVVLSRQYGVQSMIQLVNRMNARSYSVDGYTARDDLYWF